MSKVIGYRFVTSNDQERFEHAVEKLLKEGWELYGNPTHCYQLGDSFEAFEYGQALVKREDNNG